MKNNPVSKHLAEIVNFGGIPMPRAEMLQRLAETAKQSGHLNPQNLVNAYCGGLQTVSRPETH